MKHAIQPLLTDVKAAVRIGHSESLWIALDGLLDLPEVAGNPPLSESFLHQAILPIGQTLAQSRLNAAALKPLADQPQAALRAIAAAALVTQYLNGGATTLKQLNYLGQDPRKDVRLGLVLAAQAVGEDHPERLAELAKSWLAAPSPRKQSVALRLLPSLAQRDAGNAITLIKDFPISSDAEVRAVAVEALAGFANQGLGKEVIEVLAAWKEPDRAALWVVAKTLSRSWAADHPEAALAILAELARQAGPRKPVYKAVQALSQHGAAEEVQSAIAAWQTSGDPNLQAAAEKIRDTLNPA